VFVLESSCIWVNTVYRIESAETLVVCNKQAAQHVSLVMSCYLEVSVAPFTIWCTGQNSLSDSNFL
jgi:hypothetical protein